jgi:alpha-galactosidase
MKDAPSPEAAHKMMIDAYIKMRDALRKTGRPIVYSLCQYGNDAVWQWGASVGGNLWRTTGDIKDNYARMEQIGFSQSGLAKYAGPGHWNDPDMLEVGNGVMNPDEYRTHLSLWAILAAPLLAGNDLTSMTPETVALLTNREVIAIDQDPAGKQEIALAPRAPWKSGFACWRTNQKPGICLTVTRNPWICRWTSANLVSKAPSKRGMSGPPRISAPCKAHIRRESRDTA